jgi:hypothetical protein
MIRRDLGNTSISLVNQLNINDFSSCGSISNASYTKGVCTVLFYIPNSKPCNDFIQEYNRFAENYAYNSNINPLSIDLGNGMNNRLISMSKNFPFNLLDFPTIIIYYDGSPCSAYMGRLTSQDLYAFASKVVDDKTCFKFAPCT